MHTVLNSYDVLGGPNTFNAGVGDEQNSASETRRPTRPCVDALEGGDAVDQCDKHGRGGRDLRIKDEGIEARPGLVKKIVSDPQIEYTLAPKKSWTYANFMYKIGAHQEQAGDWKDLFFPEIHDMRAAD